MTAEKKRILVVDDAQDNIVLISQMLKSDYHVTVAHSGHAALQMLDGPEFPDLVLLDVVMPEMDGYEVCRRLKQNSQTADIPIIFLTVKADVIDEELGLKLGAVDYITKPFSPPIVLARVQTHLALKAAADSLRQKNIFLEEEVARRRTVEQALQLSNRNLECINRELETFSYSVSHDLKAPMRRIAGFGKILWEDHEKELTAEAVVHLERIIAATAQMEKMIEGLLDLARLSRSTLNVETVNLSELATNIMEELHQADPARTVAGLVQPDLLVRGDSRLLGILLRNLIGNAWKFTKGKDDPRVELYSAVANGETAYCIRDNGAGFDMAYASQLFAPFRRLHSEVEFPGTGIGLATVSRIVHRHGGVIWAESTVQKGATFAFTLGVECQVAATANDEMAMRAPLCPEKQIVLIVDDAPDNLSLMSQLLKTDYHVKVANSGTKALQIAAGTIPPDLILLDIMMPEIDGYEVCRRLKAQEKTRDIPVIFLTAKNDVADEQLGLSLGAVDYINKPFSPPIVLARIKMHLQMKLVADYLREKNIFLENEAVKRIVKNR